MKRSKVLALALAAGALGAGAPAYSQTAAPSDAPVAIPDINVVGSTPLLGSGVDPDKIPAATNVLTSKDIARTGYPTLTGAILQNIPSATVNDVDGNPFQPDIIFRGYTASPVAGTAQGLAVYINGARFNDGFGDTVNWDLIPSQAIETVNVEASNPTFGLNALGGSINVEMKNGFDFQGVSLTAMGGGYGRLWTGVEAGQKVGNFAAYIASDYIHDNGFRETGGSDLRRIYGDLGWRGDSGETHLSITAAGNNLGNPGAAPVEALDANIKNIFTAPNTVNNQYFALNMTGNYALGGNNSVQTVAYFHRLNQNIPNGTTVDATPCNDGSNYLCNGDGSYLTGSGGQPISDWLNGGPYSGLSVQNVATSSYGASGQWTNESPIAGKANHFISGVSYDGSSSDFQGSFYIGGFDPYSRQFIGPGYLIVDPSEGVNPVNVGTTSNSYALYAQDIYSLTPALNFTVSGRFNYEDIHLTDLLGGPVNGDDTYFHFNPGVGLTYQIAPWIQAYGGYSVSNRTPTPQELSCASPATPCSLLNFFVGDPPLRQVVAQTFELGLRGTVDPFASGRLTWNADYYHAENSNDIIYQTTTDLSANQLAYYTNAGKTLRQGVELNLRYDVGALHTLFGYAYTDATFQSWLLLGSPNNPYADANGNIQVRPGNQMPGIPRNRVTVAVDYDANDKWTIGGSLTAQSGQYAFGDEANLNPQIPGYLVANAHTSYKFTDKVTGFLLVNNIFNEHYYTYGTFGPIDAVPWPNIPGGVSNPSTAVPGAPFTVYAGVKITL